MREDQAQGLRQLFARRTCQIAAICGTDGTTVCTGVARALGAMGYRVCILDRTTGEAARAVGRRAKYDLAQVLDHDCSLEQALLEGPDQVAVLPCARGLERIAAERGEWRGALHTMLPQLASTFDVWLVNGPLPGHAPTAPMLLAVNSSAPAITHAYGLIKALARAQERRNFGVIVHDSIGQQAARHVHECVADTARRFLGAELELYGWVPAAAHPADATSETRRQQAFGKIADRLMTNLSTAPLLRTGSC
ncbi:MAG: hypothetical protein M3Z31_14540 [Pseudomonadota bacterium]|nr:hypothetical protein [Pseudomonadota bacterium]